MSTIGSVTWGIGVDLSKMTSGVRQAQEMVRKTSETMESTRGSASTMTKALTDIEGGARKAAGALGGMVGQAVSFAAGNAVYAAGSKVFGALSNALVGTNSTLETTTLQFKSLGLSSSEAQQHVADLFKFAKDTPFETEPIIQASRQLRVFGGAGLDTTANLRLFGDTAAATNADLGQLTFWIGRLYSAAQAGKPFGEALQNLQELGVLSPQVVTKLSDMSEKGAKFGDVWKVVTGDLGRFNGAMNAQAGTWQGLTSTISDAVNLTAASVLKPFFTNAEGGLKRLADFLSGPQLASGAQQLAANLETGLQRGLQAVQRFWSQFGPTIVGVGQGLIDVGRHAGDLVAGFQSMLPSFGSANQQAGTLKTILSDLRGVLEFVASNMRTIGIVLAVLVPIWVAWNAAILVTRAIGIITFLAQLVAQMAVATSAEGLLAGAQVLLNVVMTANPIGLVIVGLAALIAVVVLAVTHWKQIVGALQSAWQWMANVYDKVGVVHFALQGLVEPIKVLVAHWGDVTAAIQSAWGALQSFASGLSRIHIPLPHFNIGSQKVGPIDLPTVTFGGWYGVAARSSPAAQR